MPRKEAPNPKALAARSRKEQASAEKRAKEVQAQEDARWADDGPQGRAAKKRAEAEQRRQEAAQKREEVERMKREEEREMGALSRRGAKGPKTEASQKVTRAEMELAQEEEGRQRAEAEKQRRRMLLRVQAEDEYARQVEVQNTNRMEAALDARNLDDAISQLSLVNLAQSKAEKNWLTEKKLRAAYRAYEEGELPRLRTDTPGLTLSQYKELIWKSWKKAPQNPLNQSHPR